MKTWDALKADTHRLYNEFSYMNLARGFLTHRTFRCILTMRLCQAVDSSNKLQRIFMLPLFKVAHNILCGFAAIDLPWRTQFGAGLNLVHGWGLVVSHEAIIGNNVTILHGATLGRRDKILSNGEREISFPMIEDEVWIGPHAIIVGGVVIGKGSIIGPGAFVNTNIPPHSVVIGNPSKIIKSNCVADVINPAPTKFIQPFEVNLVVKS